MLFGAPVERHTTRNANRRRRLVLPSVFALPQALELALELHEALIRRCLEIEESRAHAFDTAKQLVEVEMNGLASRFCVF